MKSGTPLCASRVAPKAAPGNKAAVGRKRWIRNYAWSSELDEALRTAWAEGGAAAAIRAIQAVHPDWNRYAIQRRARKLGLQRRRRPWSPDEVNLLLHSIGGQGSVASVAAIVKRSENSVRSKLRQLNYSPDDFEGYRPKDLANWFDVPVREVRYWVERRYLETNNHRVTEESLCKFMRQRPELIPYDRLPSAMQFWLRDMGYPAPGRSGESVRRRSTRRRRATSPRTSEQGVA
jgi:hypothetical protein